MVVASDEFSFIISVSAVVANLSMECVAAVRGTVLVAGIEFTFTLTIQNAAKQGEDEKNFSCCFRAICLW